MLVLHSCSVLEGLVVVAPQARPFHAARVLMPWMIARPDHHLMLVPACCLPVVAGHFDAYGARGKNVHTCWDWACERAAPAAPSRQLLVFMSVQLCDQCML